MKRGLRRFFAPRPSKAGAFHVGASIRTTTSLPTAASLAMSFSLSALMLSGALIPSAAVAQVGGFACSLPEAPLAGADSVGAVPGLPVADSSGQVPGLPEADSSAIVADSARVLPKLSPAISSAVEPSYGLGLWCWDSEALLSARAVTLAELVSLVPGVIALKGGDYGTPVTVMSFGAGGGRVRVLWDGFEWMPLEGAVPDLSRIGLAGLDEVRVERHPGELRISLRTSVPTNPEPATLVHVGTGDLGTNLLRGVFVHPNAFRGAFTFVLDRVETRGPGLDAAGTLSGFALRYEISRGDRGGIVAEMKRFAPRTDVADLSAGLTRNDWNVRARWQIAEGLIGEGYGGASSLAGGPEDPVYGGLDTRRTQLGLRTKYTIGNLWAQASARRFSGHGVPGEDYEVTAGGTHASGATVDGSLRVERWAGRYARYWRARVETAPLRGFSLFAAYEVGETGAPFVSEYEEYLRSLRPGPPVAATPIAKPRPRFTDRTGIRAGGSFSWRGFNVAGAWLSVKADSLRPLGLALDPGGVSLEGGDRTGFEATVRVPLPLRGFVLEGAVQAWDEGLAYLPKLLLDGAVTYHGIFKESRNLEVWGGLGVTSRDPMSLAILEAGGDPTVPELVMVPRSEEWYAHIQVRIVMLNIFVRWENIRGKADNIDFPTRTQPRFRTLYGVRWVMNN